MIRTIRLTFFYLTCLITCFYKGNAQSPANIIIKTNEIKSKIQPTMWGIFFEDINLGADGGIYAELVKNRSFEFNAPLMGWIAMEKTNKKISFFKRLFYGYPHKVVGY